MITEEPQSPGETELLCTTDVSVLLRFGGSALPGKGHSGNDTEGEMRKRLTLSL